MCKLKICDVQMKRHVGWGERVWRLIGRVFLHTLHRLLWACLGDLPPVQTAGDLGFIVQLNSQMSWHFVQLHYFRFG